jgi:hypothetical protein
MAASPNAQSASISLHSGGPGEIPVIAIEGPIEPGDDQRFWTRACMLPKAIVALKSPGGSAFTGIHLGEMIRRKNFDTAVPDNAMCASACAVAWLGGVRRFAGAGAKIGFHATCVGRRLAPGTETKGDPCRRSEEQRVALESSAADAALAAYARKIGLNDSAHLYITKAPHEALTLLNAADGRQHGIDFTRVDFPLRRTNSAAGAEPAGQSTDLKKRAIQFVNSLFEDWSKPNESALAALGGLYPPEVSYYGSLRTRQAVLLDKRQSAERWPNREYKLRPNSLSAMCDAETSTCRLDGIVNWKVGSPRRQASAEGATSFVYTVLFTGESFTILLESTADRAGGDVPRHPAATCEPMPLYYFPGALSLSRNSMHP